jgi:putative DNA primase/helicase
MSDLELPRLLKEMRDHFFNQGYPVPESVTVTDGKKPFRFDPDDPKGDRCWIFVNALNHTSKPGQFIVATLGDWRDPDLRLSFKSETNYDASDRASVQAQLAEQKRRANLEKVKEQRLACERAAKLFGEGEKREHPYLKAKRLSGLHGALVHPQDNALMIPMRGPEGKLWGLQRIYNLGKEKRFLSGQKKQGTFHTIPDSADPLKEPLLILCEGFATGASIHEATGRPVLVCFDAGNLVHVAQTLYKEIPETSFIIAGDDDRFNDTNTGAESAEKARIVCGGSVALPKFPFNDEDSTDFNDLASISGKEVVRDQIEDAIKKHRPMYVRCLGVDSDGFFLTTSENKQLSYFKTLDSMTCLKLMPVAYWEARYPGKKSSVDWTAAASDLMDKCRRSGQYQMTHTRGRGVWIDNGDLVIHMGDRLKVNGREIGLHDIRSRYCYVSDVRMEKVHPIPLTLEECGLFRDVVSGLRVKDEWSKMFLLGWPIQAMLGGASQWRSHLHLTGDAGSGKSTILERVIWKMVEPLGYWIQGGTTEAGLRNRIKAGSLAVVVDEIESRNKDAAARIEAVLDYIRISSSGGRIVKGSSGGGFVEYSAYSTFALASITDIIKRQSDATRFIQVHLKKTEGDPEQWPKLEKSITRLSENQYAERMFSRAIDRFGQFKTSQEVLFRVVARKEGERIAQLYSAVLAGWNLVESDEPISEARAEIVVGRIGRDEEKATSQTKDWEELVSILISSRIDAERERVPVGTLVSTIMNANVMGGPSAESLLVAERSLSFYGMRVIPERKALFVSSNNVEIRRLLTNTIGDHNYETILRRVPGSDKGKQRVGGLPRNGILIPLDTISVPE